jgi:chromosome segregation ATPase
MGLSPDERERRLAARERAVAAAEAEASRLGAVARAAHRAAERERNRARKLGARIARKLHHAFSEARARLDADRAALDARAERFNAAQSEYHAASAADRDRQRTARAELTARQKRLAAEWAETNRFQAQQAAALDARATELAAREKAAADERAKAQREAAALREEAAALDTRVRNARQLVDELEQRRAELRADVPAAAPGADPPVELRVALDRAADRDLGKLAAELTEREERLKLERAAVQALSADVSAEHATLADRRRILAEQFAQLVSARAQWQEAERATVAEMERLADTLRRREAELDARAHRLARADVRRRADAYDLWQLRLRLEAWQSKLVAYEMRWCTEQERLEADLARRFAELARREAQPSDPAGADGADGADAIPLALPVEETDLGAVSAELGALREELERMAAVLLEAELPEPPDPPESELPWGTEEVPTALPVESDEADVLLFDPTARAA